jgi:O-antigen/teichoic acid export membrane protein
VIPEGLEEHRENGATGLPSQWFGSVSALTRIWKLCSPRAVLKVIRGNRRLMKEMFGVGWGQAAAAIGGVVAVRVLTGLLGPAAYGELALALTVSTLAQLALLAPVAASAQRFLAASQEANEMRSFLQAIGVLFFTATAAVAILGITGLFLLSNSSSGWLGLMCAALLLSWLSGINGILDAIQNAARERNVVAWHQALGQWLRVLLPIALAAVCVPSSAMAIYAYCLAAVLVTASQLAFFWRTIVPRASLQPLDKAIIQQKIIRFWYYCWPFATWGLFTWAQSASDRWALELFRQKSDVGIYQVLYQLGYSPIITVTGYITWLASPILFARVGDGDVNDLIKVWGILKRIVSISLCATFIFSVAAACCSRMIFSLLASDAYRSGAHLLPLLVLNGGLFATGQFATLQLMCSSRTGVLVAPKVVTAVVGVCANFVASYCWGPPGVATAGTVTSAIYFLWVVWLVRRQMRCPSVIRHFEYQPLAPV